MIAKQSNPRETMAVAEQPLPQIEVVPRDPAGASIKQVKLNEVKPSPSLREVGIEISNGNGVNQMARKVGNYLKEVGMKVVRLTNANHFNFEKTKIIYENGYEAEAEYVSEQLPAGKHTLESVKRLDRPYIKVKVLIGKDLIQYKEGFDSKRVKIVSKSPDSRKGNN